MTKESARFLIKDAIISAGRSGERKPQNMRNTGKALYVERETTKYIKYTKYTKRRYAQDCQRGKSPRKTRTTRKSTACGEENHKIHQTHQKALCAGLPAWKESTENTDHTEKHCMWRFTTALALSYRRSLAHSRRAWGDRGGVAASL